MKDKNLNSKLKWVSQRMTFHDYSSVSIVYIQLVIRQFISGVHKSCALGFQGD